MSVWHVSVNDEMIKKRTASNSIAEEWAFSFNIKSVTPCFERESEENLMGWLIQLENFSHFVAFSGGTQARKVLFLPVLNYNLHLAYKYLYFDRKAEKFQHNFWIKTPSSQAIFINFVRRPAHFGALPPSVTILDNVACYLFQFEPVFGLTTYCYCRW